MAMLKPLIVIIYVIKLIERDFHPAMLNTFSVALRNDAVTFHALKLT